MKIQKKNFIVCEKCGKKLIERLPNGLFKFVFGGKQYPPPVELYVHGSIKMRCLRRSCAHWNVISFLPNFNSPVYQSDTKSESKLSENSN